MPHRARSRRASTASRTRAEARANRPRTPSAIAPVDAPQQRSPHRHAGKNDLGKLRRDTSRLAQDGPRTTGKSWWPTQPGFAWATACKSGTAAPSNNFTDKPLTLTGKIGAKTLQLSAPLAQNYAVVQRRRGPGLPDDRRL